MNKLRSEDNAVLVITHYQRLLDYIVPDVVHVLMDGKIVKTGGKELAHGIRRKRIRLVKSAKRFKQPKRIMSLKDKLSVRILSFKKVLDADSPIYDLRGEAIKTFEAEGFPSKKDENWKYTSLNSILKEDYSILPTRETALDFKDVKQYFIHDIDTYNIVFIDGVFSSYLSSTTHDGIDVCTMNSALTKPKYQQVIDVYFNKIAKEESLTALNTAFAKEGAYIYIPKGKVADKPIQIIHFSTGNEGATFYNHVT